MTTENSTYIENSAQKTATEDNFDKKLTETAEPAEAENMQNAAPDTGKFKSVEALMSAYLALEAEFTRRSQRLKELEESKAAEAPSPECLDKEKLLSAALASSSVREAVVGEYLKTVFSGKSVPLIIGGVSCAAPQSSPKSVKEAAALAKQFLKN
ncbi:MAG: hypothetical protein J1F61_05960 [Clostridiales bacterium]|nr:hypothetical protein [Clostridiales bacterium]